MLIDNVDRLYVDRQWNLVFQLSFGILSLEISKHCGQESSPMDVGEQLFSFFG
jgi:hypothetical protein